MTVYVGQRVRVECQFRLRGVPTNPTIVQAFIRTPSGSISSLTYPDPNFVNIDIGKYEIYQVVDEPGTWYFRAEGLGAADAVDETPLIVEPSVFS